MAQVDRQVSRKEAKAGGLKWYFTGRPCIHGHISVRKTSDKICRECRRLYSAKRYHDDPAAASDRKRAAYRKNIASAKARRKKIYWADPESARKKTREWNAANPEKANHQARIKRARKRLASGSHSIDDVKAIRKMQKNKCAYCRVSLRCVAVHVDHITALSRGGANDRTNLQITCASCNSSKKATDPIDFARSLGRLV